MEKHKPTKADLADAKNRRVPDVIAPHLRILFVGINPGIYTAAVGRHFAHPANRFWRALCDSGFTQRLLSPFENEELLALGLGITNIVERPTLRASELSKEELIGGWHNLEKKVRKFRPAWIAICGLDAYRLLFNKEAQIGEQPDKIGRTRIWLLPNPSGLNATFTPTKLSAAFSEIRQKAWDC